MNKKISIITLIIVIIISLVIGGIVGYALNRNTSNVQVSKENNNSSVLQTQSEKKVELSVNNVTNSNTTRQNVSNTNDN